MFARMTDSTTSATLLEGADIDHNRVSIFDAKRGKACDLFCPICGDGLVAKQGGIVHWHFAHDSGVDGERCAEGTAHLSFKEGIAEGCIEHGFQDRPVQDVATEWRIKSVNLRPDILMKFHDGDYLAVEVAVSSFKDRTHVNKYRRVGIECLELVVRPPNLGIDDAYEAWVYRKDRPTRYCKVCAEHIALEGRPHCGKCSGFCMDCKAPILPKYRKCRGCLVPYEPYDPPVSRPPWKR